VVGVLAASAQQRDEGLQRLLVALLRGLAGGERLDDAGARQGGLVGDVFEEGPETGDCPGLPAVGLGRGVDDALQRFLDREVLGREEASCFEEKLS